MFLPPHPRHNTWSHLQHLLPIRLLWAPCLISFDRLKYIFIILSTEIARIGDGKKIVCLEYIAEEQLIMVIAGRQRQVKLVPVRALGGEDVEWIKVSF